jgi:hypothetical protein
VHRNTSTPNASSASSPNPQSISSLLAMSAARAFSTAFRAGAPRAPIAARVAGIRGYAAAAPSSGASKPPVALFGVDGTYASALVRLPRSQFEAWKMLEDGNQDAMAGDEAGANKLHSTPQLRKQTSLTPPQSRSSLSPLFSRRTPSSSRSSAPPL